MPEYPSNNSAPVVHRLPVRSEVRRSGAVDLHALPHDQPPDWRRYLSAAIRYRWWIMVAGVLGTAGGWVASHRLAPSYMAQATIWIQASEPRGADRGPIGSDQLLAASAWLDLLKSYVVLDDVVRDLRLYLSTEPSRAGVVAGLTVDEDFRPGRYRVHMDKNGETLRLEGDRGVELDHGGVGDSLGRPLGFRWVPASGVLEPGATAEFVVTPLRDAAKRLGDDLRVSIDPSGNFLRLSLTGVDGSTAATIVNAIARRYVAVAIELKRAKLTELARLLNEQFQAADTSLRQAESALRAFRVRTITLPPDPVATAGVPAVNDFFALKIEQDHLRRDRRALEDALARLGSGSGSVDAIAAIGAVQRSPDLTRALQELTAKRADLRVLRYRYTDDHPTLRRVAAEIDTLERGSIRVLAQGLVADLAARDRLLASQIESGGEALRGMPQRAIEEARLRRDVSIAEHLFTSVQQRYSEARLAEASSIADMRILDVAVAPQRPIKDRNRRLIALGLIMGIGLGLMGAVLVDRFDPRVRYPDQVTHDIGLPILGVLPHVKDRQAGPDDEHVAEVIEAMRSVRLNLTHAYGTAGPMVVTITSPGIGDGKSLVSANLALSYAEAGHRTLLIDGDTRRGALHRALKRSRKPGLTDALAGHVPFEGAIQTTAWPSLDFIGAGTRYRDSPELLANAAMVELMGCVRTQYDVILVDSPPLGSGVDPYTLGALTGSLLLVLRTGATSLEFARMKLVTMEYLPIRLLGAIVNDVRPGSGYRYYAYLSGYGTTDEGTALTAPKRRGML